MQSGRSYMKIIGHRRFPLIFFAFLSGGEARAEVLQGANGWYCGVVSDWQSAQITIGGKIAINNFMLKERDAIMASSLRVIEVSYSATNRASDPVAFNSQVVGLDSGGAISFALEANPSLDMLSDMSTETISGDSYVIGSPLSSAMSLCIGFFADL